MQQPMQPPKKERVHRPRKKKHRIRRFLKAYLMIVGSLTTGYVLIQLIVRILVELAGMN